MAKKVRCGTCQNMRKGNLKKERSIWKFHSSIFPSKNFSFGCLEKEIKGRPNKNQWLFLFFHFVHCQMWDKFFTLLPFFFFSCYFIIAAIKCMFFILLELLLNTPVGGGYYSYVIKYMVLLLFKKKKISKNQKRCKIEICHWILLSSD